MEKKLILWGAGLLGKQALRAVEMFSDSDVLFGDNDNNKLATQYCGKTVVGIYDVVSMFQREQIEMIVLTTRYWEEVFIQLCSYGITKEIIKIFNGVNSKIVSFTDMYILRGNSQDGEDLFLKQIFRGKNEGVYVDVGANHPCRFSNTWWAYQRGWRGINVEPNIKNFNLLEIFRSEDINVNCGIANQENEIEYYEFRESALNTFCKEDAEIIGDILNVRKVPVCSLSKILEKYSVFDIDFMDIDVEGMEMEVLTSIKWEEMCIRFILLEQRGMNLKEIIQSEEYIFLANQGYEAINKYNRTVIYEKKSKHEK